MGPINFSQVQQDPQKILSIPHINQVSWLYR